MTAVALLLIEALICQSPAKPAKPTKPATRAAANDEVTKFLTLNRDVQILRAEKLIADDPKNRDAKRLLGSAKKLPLKAIPLVPSGVGQFGYWPEPKVQVSRSMGGGSYLAAIGTGEAVVRGVPEVPGDLLLVVTGAETIRKVGVRTTKKDIEGRATERKAYDEQYDVPVVEVLDIKKATQALEKEIAELKKAKQ